MSSSATTWIEVWALLWDPWNQPFELRAAVDETVPEGIDAESKPFLRACGVALRSARPLDILLAQVAKAESEPERFFATILASTEFVLLGRPKRALEVLGATHYSSTVANALIWNFTTSLKLWQGESTDSAPKFPGADLSDEESAILNTLRILSQNSIDWVKFHRKDSELAIWHPSEEASELRNERELPFSTLRLLQEELDVWVGRSRSSLGTMGDLKLDLRRSVWLGDLENQFALMESLGGLYLRAEEGDLQAQGLRLLSLAGSASSGPACAVLTHYGPAEAVLAAELQEIEWPPLEIQLTSVLDVVAHVPDVWAYGIEELLDLKFTGARPSGWANRDSTVYRAAASVVGVQGVDGHVAACTWILAHQQRFARAGQFSRPFVESIDFRSVPTPLTARLWDLAVGSIDTEWRSMWARAILVRIASQLPDQFPPSALPLDQPLPLDVLAVYLNAPGALSADLLERLLSTAVAGSTRMMEGAEAGTINVGATDFLGLLAGVLFESSNASRDSWDVLVRGLHHPRLLHDQVDHALWVTAARFGRIPSEVRAHFDPQRLGRQRLGYFGQGAEVSVSGTALALLLEGAVEDEVFTTALGFAFDGEAAAQRDVPSFLRMFGVQSAGMPLFLYLSQSRDAAVRNAALWGLGWSYADGLEISVVCLRRLQEERVSTTLSGPISLLSGVALRQAIPSELDRIVRDMASVPFMAVRMRANEILSSETARE